MNSIAFLFMLAVFAGLAYWYILNIEAESDGARGFLGLKPDAELPIDELSRKLADHPKAGHRAAFDRVREKAQEARDSAGLSAKENTRTSPTSFNARRKAEERRLEEDLREIETVRRRYHSSASEAVRRRVGKKETSHARSPFVESRGSEPVPLADTGRKIRNARLGRHGRQEEESPRDKRVRVQQMPEERPRSYKIREKRRPRDED